MSFFSLEVSELLFTFIFFFFNDTATTEIYTLSLHDALPISVKPSAMPITMSRTAALPMKCFSTWGEMGDRKSTRLNSSHLVISYAVFCLKKKKYKSRTEHTEKRSSRDGS